MRRNFGAKTWLYPMPVLIVGTYGEDGFIDVKRLDPIIYEGVRHGYYSFGDRVGQAFSDGKKLK